MYFAISASSKGIGVPWIDAERCSEMDEAVMEACDGSDTFMMRSVVVAGVMPKRRKDSAI